MYDALIQACKLKLGDYRGALVDAGFAIRSGYNNAKPLFRQGQVGLLYHGFVLIPCILLPVLMIKYI